MDTAEHACDSSSDDEDFSLASLYDEEGGVDDSGSSEEHEDEDDVSGDEDDEDEEDNADAQEHTDEDSEHDSDEDDSSPWGQFGIWTSLGFDKKRGDMVVSDSGTRYSEGSVWLS